MQDATIRSLTTDDLAEAHGLTAAVGWPHRAEDWRFVLDLGFGIAAERDGKLAGTAIGWRYGSTAGAVGMINTPDMAEEILANGRADLIIMGRKLMAEPQWPLMAARQLHSDQAWPVQYERAMLS